MTGFLSELRKNKIAVSPLFSVPGFVLSMIAIDVLHTLDLGISQDALGNLFHTFWNSILAKTNNKLTKTKELWDRIKSYYQRVHPPTTLNGLSVEMIQVDGKKTQISC